MENQPMNQVKAIQKQTARKKTGGVYHHRVSKNTGNIISKPIQDPRRYTDGLNHYLSIENGTLMSSDGVKYKQTARKHTGGGSYQYYQKVSKRSRAEFETRVVQGKDAF